MADGSEGQNVTTAGKGKRRRWLWVVGVLLALLVWNYWPMENAITISPETTYITRPLNADGTVNYFQAIVDRYSEGVTPENNAAVLLVRALGPKVFDEEVRSESLRQLGLTEEELEKDRPYFETFEDFHKRHVSDEDANSDGADPTYVLDELNCRPWSAKDHPLVVAWLEANEKPLELIVEASRRERFYFPLVAIEDPPNILDSWQFYCQAPYEGIRPLLVRGMLKLGSGRPQQAYADLVAAHSLARGPGDGSMPSLMLAIGVQAMVNEADHAILQSDLTSHDLRSILAARQALPTIPSFASVFDNERLFALDCVMLIYRQGLHAITEADSPSGKVITNSVLAVDWDEVLKTTNYWWGRKIAATIERNYADHLRRTKECDAAVERSLGIGDDFNSDDELSIKLLLYGLGGRSFTGPRTRYITRTLFRLLWPTAEALRKHYEILAAESDILTLALAAKLYKAETGQWPADLAALAPEYVDAIPADRFTDEPLRYIRTDGGVTIYSLGPNMTDDAGLNYSESRVDDVDGDAETDIPEDADDIAIAIE